MKASIASSSYGPAASLPSSKRCQCAPAHGVQVPSHRVKFLGNLATASARQPKKHPPARPFLCRASLSPTPSRESTPTLYFPGGGMFFYWQIGCIRWLCRSYDLTDTRMVGASAGALAATLAACQVDVDAAAALALELAKRAGVWDRPTGLGGVWGPMIKEWLHVLLPEDAARTCGSGRVHLVVLQLPSLTRRQLSFRHQCVSDFASKVDLVDTCLASVHIPFFIDGRPYYKLAGRRVIDGSIFADKRQLWQLVQAATVLPAGSSPPGSAWPRRIPDGAASAANDLEGNRQAEAPSLLMGAVCCSPTQAKGEAFGEFPDERSIFFDYFDDERMKQRRTDFLSLASKGEGAQGTWRWMMSMMDAGEEHARQMAASGALDALAAHRR
eukprot:jgi/Mesvir1/26798/Mv20565-RA.1